MIMVQSLTNTFGDAFIAANTIVMKVDGLIIMPIFSFGAAITVYAGQNVGANRYDRVKEGKKQCALLTVFTSILIVACILLFGRQIAGMFTETQVLLDIAMRLLRILAPGYIAFALTQVLWGVIRGAGDTMTPMWLSLVSAMLRVSFAYLLVHLTGNPESILYAVLIAWVTGTVPTFIFYRIGRWRTMGLIK